jgi:bifunctional DNA-binding transcriptional regulator/antitoxin component of YhaV-PrlF toxin-antitoxin module
MSAALLSLGERAAEGLGRGELSQVYVEGEEGTVFLVSADDEAVLVAVAARGAKAGLMLFEVRRAAAAVADALREEADAEEWSEADTAAATADRPDGSQAQVPLQAVTSNGWPAPADDERNGRAADPPFWT